MLPARAPVVHERIETEMPAATGIVNEQGNGIAAVVLITAGCAANGKYNHYLVTQVPFVAGANLSIEPGNCTIGWDKVDDGLNVHVYAAASGRLLGSVHAAALDGAIRVTPIRIWPPQERSLIQIGRFAFAYHLK